MSFDLLIPGETPEAGRRQSLRPTHKWVTAVGLVGRDFGEGLLPAPSRHSATAATLLFSLPLSGFGLQHSSSDNPVFRDVNSWKEGGGENEREGGRLCFGDVALIMERGSPPTPNRHSPPFEQTGGGGERHIVYVLLLERDALMSQSETPLRSATVGSSARCHVFTLITPEIQRLELQLRPGGSPSSRTSPTGLPAALIALSP